MISDRPREQTILRNLGDGLILRRATVADTDALAAFDAEFLADPGQPPDQRLDAEVRDMMSGKHPVLSASDFTVVEDTRTGAIVSSLNLISQTWSYGGIKFGVGRPELVVTHPDYRRRGLVRAQFEVVHQWSRERGEKVQGITGIPWYYRQFGYDMALELGGGRMGYELQVPKLKEGESEPYRVRPAAEADVPFMAELYERAFQRYLVAGAYRDEAMWRYDLTGRRENSDGRMEMRVIETGAGEPVGVLLHGARLWNSFMGALVYELRPGASWLAVTPTVVRYLMAFGEQVAAREGKEECAGFAFYLGSEHPVYQVMHEGLPQRRKPYAWYIRVPDLPDFLRHVAPVLERRLETSVVPGYSGEVKLSFYKSGVRLAFENGRLATAESWMPTPAERGDAGFPDLTFLQVLFGYRTILDLREVFPDCWVKNDEVGILLWALFPKQMSRVIPIS
jgi:hypothetical protein